MRISFAIALVSFGIAVASASTTNLDFTEVNFEDFMRGLLLGALETADPEIETCVLDGKTVLLTIERAVRDLKEGTEESVEEGVHLIGEAIQEASLELVDCDAAEEDFARLAHMASSFAHPWAFAFHAGMNIIINHVEITNEIQTAIQAWDAPDYQEFGFNVGEALAHVLVAEENAQATVSVE
jgi:hypothetical protein